MRGCSRESPHLAKISTARKYFRLRLFCSKILFRKCFQIKNILCRLIGTKNICHCNKTNQKIIKKRPNNDANYFQKKIQLLRGCKVGGTWATMWGGRVTTTKQGDGSTWVRGRLGFFVGVVVTIWEKGWDRIRGWRPRGKERWHWWEGQLDFSTKVGGAAIWGEREDKLRKRAYTTKEA